MTIEFYIFKLVYVPNFSFNNFNFLNKFAIKSNEGTSPLNSSYLS